MHLNFRGLSPNLEQPAASTLLPGNRTHPRGRRPGCRFCWTLEFLASDQQAFAQASSPRQLLEVICQDPIARQQFVKIGAVALGEVR